MKLNKIQFHITPHHDLFQLEINHNNNCSRPNWRHVLTDYLGVIMERVFKYTDNLESIKITITYKK